MSKLIIFTGIFYCLLLSGVWAQGPKNQLEKLYSQAIDSFEKGKTEQGYQYLDQCLAIDSTYRDALYAKGFFETEEQKWLQAEQSFNKLLRLHPTDTVGYLARAEARIALERYTSAQADIQAAYNLDSTRLEPLISWAKLYLETGYYQKANDYLEEALTRTSQKAELLQLKAYYYWVTRQTDDALAYVNQGLQLDPKNPDLQRIKAYIFYDQSKYKEVIKIYQEIVSKTKDGNFLEEEDFYYWAMAHLRLKNYAQALYILQTPEKPENPLTYYGLAQAQFFSKQYAQALVSIQKAFEDTTEPPGEWLYNRSVIEWYNQQKSQAKESFMKSLVATPELVFKQNAQGQSAEVIMDASRLLTHLVSEKEKDSLQVLGFQQRAFRYLSEDQTEKAQKDIQSALKLDSLNSYTYLIKALACSLENKQELECQKYFDLAFKMPRMRDTAHIYFMQGVVASDREEYFQALQFLEKAITLKPRTPEYYVEKSHIFYQTNAIAEAIETINYAIELDPSQLENHNERLLYLLEDGQNQKVISLATALLQLEPDNPKGYYYRGLAYYENKDWDKAYTDLEKVLEFYPDDQDVINLLKDIQQNR